MVPLTYNCNKYEKPENVLKPKPFVEHAVCDKRCLQTPIETDHRGQNPLTIHEHYGWERIVKPKTDFVLGDNGKLKSASSYDVKYVAPCGRSLNDIKEVDGYLKDTNSSLPIDYFSFDKNIVTKAKDRIQSGFHVEDDFSKGFENQPVSVINKFKPLGPIIGKRFVYKACRTMETENQNRSGNQLKSCCDCIDDCSSEKCECRKFTQTMFNTVKEDKSDKCTFGYEYRRLIQTQLSPIFECGPFCRCNSSKGKCSNRLVQFGLSHQLQLFKHPKKGYGVRALHDIPAGSFICTYEGELLTTEEADDGRDTTYQVQVDLIAMLEEKKRNFYRNYVTKYKEWFETMRKVPYENTIDKHGLKAFVSDAKTQGNIGLYINHSCDPNLSIQTVMVDTDDLRFPSICFFTKRTIKALQELTFDYAFDTVSLKVEKKKCLCMTRKCRRVI